MRDETAERTKRLSKRANISAAKLRHGGKALSLVARSAFAASEGERRGAGAGGRRRVVAAGSCGACEAPGSRAGRLAAGRNYSGST